MDKTQSNDFNHGKSPAALTLYFSNHTLETSDVASFMLSLSDASTSGVLHWAKNKVYGILCPAEDGHPSQQSAHTLACRAVSAARPPTHL